MPTNIGACIESLVPRRPRTAETISLLSNQVGLVPKILPGELVQGWRGRLRVINLLGHVRDTLLLLERVASVTYSDHQSTDFVDLAAFALSSTRQELERQHTLAPFYDAVAAGNRGDARRSISKLGLPHTRFPLRIDGKISVLCRRCAIEDFSLRGYSHWRRDHFLPGMPWCQKHRTPLATAGGLECLDSPPHTFAHPVEVYEDFASLLENPILQRYAAIATEVLESALSVDRTTASSVLNSRARQMGLRYSFRGRRQTISQVALAQLPTGWLQRAFPRIIWNGDHVPAIDNACLIHGTSYTTASLCLIAALLYEDSDQAINEIFLGAPVTHTAKERRTRGYDYWSSKAVFDAYVANEGVALSISRELAIDPHSTREGLRSQGLPSLGSSKVLWQAAMHLSEGSSIEDACRSSGADRKEVEQLLIVAGSRLFSALKAIHRRRDQVLTNDVDAEGKLHDRTTASSQPSVTAEYVA